MIRNRNIKTLAELQQQMRVYKSAYKVKGETLKTDSRAYIKQFSLGSVIKKYASPDGFLKLDEHTHLSSKIMSVVLPLILNTTLFRGSGFITKALGALISRKVGKSLDAESLSGIFNLVKSLFNKKDKKEPRFVDYGIPPDSETY